MRVFYGRWQHLQVFYELCFIVEKYVSVTAILYLETFNSLVDSKENEFNKTCCSYTENIPT